MVHRELPHEVTLLPVTHFLALEYPQGSIYIPEREAGLREEVRSALLSMPAYAYLCVSDP